MQVLDIGSGKSAINSVMRSNMLNIGLPGGMFGTPGDPYNFEGLLDLYPAAVGYSLRRLTAYATRAISVRNDSAVTIDIGFIVGGAQDGELDTVALLAHCGAGNGYVVKWYNQQTNGSSGNFVQVTAAQQPRIVTAGSVLTRYGKPMIQMATTSQYLYCENLGLFRNRNYNRLYFTLSKPDNTGYTNLVPLSVKNNDVPAHRCLIEFGGSLGSNRSLFCMAKPTNSTYVEDADHWYFFGGTVSDSDLAFNGSISTVNVLMNWNSAASGVSAVGGKRQSLTTKHSTGATTTSSDTGTADINTLDADASIFTLGGYWNGAAITLVSALLGYNELILYTDTTQHSNDAAINAALAAYY